MQIVEFEHDAQCAEIRAPAGFVSEVTICCERENRFSGLDGVFKLTDC